MKRGTYLLVAAMLWPAGTAGAMNLTTGAFGQTADAADMASLVAGGWSVDDFVCDYAGGGATSLDICKNGCAVGNDCSGCSGPKEVATLGFQVPGDGLLDFSHDYALLIQANPAGNLECFWGTAPTGTIGAVPRQRLDAGTDDSCERLRCTGGSNPGTFCVTAGDCLGGGSCSGVCSRKQSINCTSQGACGTNGPCVPPARICVGGSNPGGACVNSAACTGGGTCTSTTADCEVVSTHVAQPTAGGNVPTLGQWTYVLVGLLMLSGAWVLWRTLA